MAKLACQIYLTIFHSKQNQEIYLTLPCKFHSKRWPWPRWPAWCNKPTRSATLGWPNPLPMPIMAQQLTHIDTRCCKTKALDRVMQSFDSAHHGHWSLIISMPTTHILHFSCTQASRIPVLPPARNVLSLIVSHSWTVTFLPGFSLQQFECNQYWLHSNYSNEDWCYSKEKWIPNLPPARNVLSVSFMTFVTFMHARILTAVVSLIDAKADT